MKSKGTNQNSLQYFMVSLYLLLVSFFIVLNAISRLTPEQSALAVQSMAETFGGQFVASMSTKASHTTTSANNIIGITTPQIGNTNATISTVLAKYLKFTDITNDIHGNISFDVALTEFFSVQDNNIRPRKKRMLKEISKTLSQNTMVQCDIITDHNNNNNIQMLDNLAFLFEYYDVTRDNIMVGVVTDKTNNGGGKLKCSFIRY